MKYIEQLRLAASWLLMVRNPDAGWGLNPGQVSSIVNTAEALYVLNRANKLPSDINRSIEFLQEALVNHPRERGPFLRYYTFGIVGLIEAGLPKSDPFLQECAVAVRNLQIGTRGWSHSATIESSRVFPSFLALWSLQKIEDRPSPETSNGLEWLLAIQKKDGGWGFTDDPNESSNAACTSYALLVLLGIYGNEPRIQRGKDWLVSHTNEWLQNPFIGESVGGTDWYHFNPTWSTMALLSIGESVFSTPIRGTTKHFRDLFDYQTGGWRQSREHVVNVRSIYWAVMAFEAIRAVMDPNMLNDIELVNLEESLSIVPFGKRNFGLFLPKAAFVPLILGISTVLVITYLIFFSDPNNKELSLVVNQMNAKIIISIILFIACILLFWKRKYVTPRLFPILTIALIGVALSIWFIESTTFTSFLTIVAFLISLWQLSTARE